MFSFENQWSSHTQDPKGCSDLRSGSSRPGAGPFLLRVPCEAAGCWVTRLHVGEAGLFVLELWPEEQASEEACHQLGTVSGSLSQPGSHPGSIFFTFFLRPRHKPFLCFLPTGRQAHLHVLVASLSFSFNVRAFCFCFLNRCHLHACPLLCSRAAGSWGLGRGLSLWLASLCVAPTLIT